MDASQLRLLDKVLAKIDRINEGQKEAHSK